jgi:cupin fold WbuC family metalloprotein
MLRTITQLEIDNLIDEAKQDPRKRAILRLHEHEEPVQRMVNAMIPGTYVAPHKHENPDKVELFSILRDTITVLHFDERGDVKNIIKLEANGPVQIVDIPPRTYHSLIPLEASAALEIIQGPYVAETHKQYASWAPRENNPKATDYLMYLTSIVENWKFKK